MASGSTARRSPTGSSRQFVDATGHVTVRRDPARPEGLSGRAAAHAVGRLARLHAARRIRSICATGASGGRSRQGRELAAARTGRRATINGARRPSGRARRLSPTRRPMRAGPARTCRPRPSGSSPRAAGSTAPSSPGATSSRPAARTWPTPGRASSRARTSTQDGFERTSPVTRVPAERLRPPRHDRQRLGMDDRLVSRRSTRPTRRRPAASRKTRAAGREDASYDPCQPQIRIPRKVLKGGSHLCAPNYCRRYRPAARHAAAGRYVHEPCRLSMRRQRRRDDHEHRQDDLRQDQTKPRTSGGSEPPRMLLAGASTLAAAGVLSAARITVCAGAAARAGAAPAGRQAQHPRHLRRRHRATGTSAPTTAA